MEYSTEVEIEFELEESPKKRVICYVLSNIIGIISLIIIYGQLMLNIFNGDDVILYVATVIFVLCYMTTCILLLVNIIGNYYDIIKNKTFIKNNYWILLGVMIISFIYSIIIFALLNDPLIFISIILLFLLSCYLGVDY